MLNVPEEVKQLFQTDSIRKNVRISFPNGEKGDLTNKDIVKGSFIFKESLCSTSNLTLGLCEASMVQFETVGIGNIKGYKLKVDCEIDCSSLGSEWCAENASTSEDLDYPFYSVPYGIFYVDKCPKKSGATKNRRTITAYTKEAFADWEIPAGIASGGKLGWYKARSYQFPLVSLEKTASPAMCEGEKTEITTIKTRQIPLYYYAQDHSLSHPYRIFLYGLVLRSNPQALPSPSSKGTVKSEGMFYNEWTASTNILHPFINTFLNGVKRKLIENGYVPDNDSFELAKKRLTQAYVYRVNVPDYSYYYYSYNPSTQETVLYTTQFAPNEEKTSTEYVMMGASGCNADYVYREREYTTISSTSEISYGTSNSCARDVFYVPAGIRILKSNIGQPWMPDGYEAKDYTFPATLKTMFDTNLSGETLIYSLDKTRSRTVTATINGESGTKTITEYYSEKPLSYDYKETLQAKLELDGLLGKFNRYGNLQYISLNSGIGLYPREDLYPKDTLYPDEPNTILNSKQYITAQWEDQYNKPFDRVSLDYTNTAGQTIYAYIALIDMDAEDYDPDDYESYTLGDNWLIKNRQYTASEIQAVLQHVADNISNIKYMPSEVTMRGMPYIEAGDYVEFLTEDSGFQTLVLQNVIEGEMYLEQTIQAE